MAGIPKAGNIGSPIEIRLPNFHRYHESSIIVAEHISDIDLAINQYQSIIRIETTPRIKSTIAIHYQEPQDLMMTNNLIGVLM